MKIKAQPIIKKFIANYLIVLIIPMLVIMFIYFNTINSFKQETYKTHLSIIEKISDDVGEYFTSLNLLVLQLGIDGDVNRFLIQENPFSDPKAISDISNLSNAIKAYTATNNYFDLVNIYSQKSGTIIGNDTTVIRLQQYYDNLFSIDGMTYDQWLNSFLNKRYENELIYDLDITIRNNKSKYFVYASTIPTFDETNIANIFVFIDHIRIQKLFQSINNIETGWFFISDYNDNAIITSRDSIDDLFIHDINSKTDNDKGYFVQKIDGENLFITYVKEDYGNRIYVSAVTLATVLESVKDIRIFLGALIMATFIVGILSVFILAYRSSNPIRKLINIFTQRGVSGDVKYDYNFLEKEILDIIIKNRKLDEEIDLYKPAEKVLLLNRLLNGESDDSDKIVESFSKIDINLDAALYGVIIASITDVDLKNSLPTFIACKVTLNDLFIKNVPELIGFYNMDFEKEVIILASSSPNRKSFRKEIENLTAEIHKSFYENTNYGLKFSGSITDNISSIYMAYYEAESALDFIQIEDKTKIKWYKKGIEQNKLHFYYPIEKELQLVNAIVEKNEYKCNVILNDIYNNNFIYNNLTPRIEKQLLDSVILTVFRVSEKIPERNNEIQNSIDKINDSLNEATDDMENEFIRLRDYIIQLCKSDNKEMNNQNILMIKSVVNHIEDNYTDCQISLSSVADHFNINEIYLSRFFKEKTGENFSKYIERLRMEKAKELLGDYGLSVSVVAEKVGYCYPQVFRRVFKRYFRKTPSHFKKI